MYSEQFKRGALCLVRLGVSTYEISDSLGISRDTLGRWMKAAGLSRGRGGGCVARNNARRKAAALSLRLDRVREHLGGRFDIVREVDTKRYVLRCRGCGHEFERCIDMRCETECPECRRREVERREAERAETMKKRALMQRIVNIIAYEHVCPECGRMFRSGNPQQVYCSKGCADRASWRRRGNGDHIKRAKRFGVEYDRSITLERLIERDGQTCYICGKRCTMDDRRWGSYGPDYPTVDHVVPLSKGGAHTWDNVRIACGECNVAKGDSVLPDPCGVAPGIEKSA